VVTLYADANPAPWGVEELRFGFPDMDLEGPDATRVVRVAKAAYRRWQAGDQVLIRCQAGLNRSGLVTALVLMIDGYTADEAIDLIRDRRSPDALFNTDFVRWLRQHAREYLSPSSDSQAA
jgi:protein-tyrosine phosphatase